MIEIQQRLLEIYDNIILELENIENGHRDFLEDANNIRNVPLNIVNERIALARDNHRRLQNARAERELIQQYNFQ